MLIAGLIPQRLQLQAQVTVRGAWDDMASRESARSRVRLGQCSFANRAVEVKILVCLHSRCSHVTEVGGLYGF